MATKATTAKKKGGAAATGNGAAGAAAGGPAPAGAAAGNGAAGSGAAPATGVSGAVASTGTGGVPATAADASAAATLPQAASAHVKPPSIEQMQQLATPAVQSVLTTKAELIDEALGVDAATLASQAADAAAAGERTLRLFESAFRSAEDYQAKAKLVAPVLTPLTQALRRLPASSSLRTAFAAFLAERNAAKGVNAAVRTKKKNKRTKATAAAQPAQK